MQRYKQGKGIFKEFYWQRLYLNNRIIGNQGEKTGNLEEKRVKVHLSNSQKGYMDGWLINLKQITNYIGNQDAN